MSVYIKPDNIPFIHNYCDRWCERCRFVDRCAVGSSEKLLETELKMELTESEEERNKIVFQHVADYHEEEDDLLQSDFNGSAKVALIATSRSIEAWEVLMKAFLEIEDMIISKLALLQKISKLLLIEFPDAPKFTRPGFDEVKFDHIQ